MSDTKASATPSPSTSSGDRSVAKSGDSSVASLETDRGTTSIDSGVVAKVAGMAAREVKGVANLGGAISGALSGVVGRIRGDEHKTAGVGVEVGSRQAAVDLTMQVLYPASIPEVADAVRQNVIDRVESLTGMEVVEVNIAVTDLAFEGGDEEPESASTRVE